MAKSKSIYVCSECGYESAKWYGKCPGCGEWNTMNEEIAAPAAAASRLTSPEPCVKSASHSAGERVSSAATARFMACTAAERASYSASSCSVGLTTVLT